MASEIKVVADAASLNRFAAEEFQHIAYEAASERGRFSVALAGGNTPRGVYSLLAEEFKTTVPWNEVHIFFGDERYVPPDHRDSNYRMANEALLSRISIPAENVHRIRTELAPDAAATDYEAQLHDFFNLTAHAWPHFDLILLGLGDDGHTASLFPGTAALGEMSRLVAANWVEKLSSHRISLTYPVLNHGTQVMFLVSGQGKAQILRNVLEVPALGLPAQRIQPENGDLLWLADQDAASLLAPANSPGT